MAAAAALSYSSYRTYLECPLRWKYLYVERRPELPRGYFTFGRVVHAVLEELVRPLVVPSARRRDGGESQTTLQDWSEPSGPEVRSARRPPVGPEELLALYDRLWTNEGYATPDEEERYRSLGRDLLLRYRDRLELEPPSPVAVEEHLETTWDGIPIHGYVDRIDRTPEGGLEVVDYKTTRELSAEDAASSEQLSVYQVLVERNYRAPVHRLTLLHLRSLTPLRTPARGPRTLDPLHQRMGEVVDGIREEAFEPTPGRHCTRCDFRSICPEFRPMPTAEGPRLAALVDRFDALRADERRLERELSQTAAELHRAAEELGLHRVPGSRAIAVRRREVAWQYPLEAVRPLLERSGPAGRRSPDSSEGVRRLLRDPTVPGEVRRKIAETGSRQVRWFWELEEPEGDAR
ncbi:MAG TPA: PD-(D/E)XK nuclease family protein [Thermoplasmata archaeon]|nr:PD-(D/E)XK nuclease family protein [Thermoplasmata archaeon]